METRDLTIDDIWDIIMNSPDQEDTPESIANSYWYGQEKND